jgi:hypothetical protein
MRGGGAAISAFLTESFIDECAHFGGNEPLAFRMAMLGGQPRLAACLQGVAHLAMWGGGADASGQGSPATPWRWTRARGGARAISRWWPRRGRSMVRSAWKP